jgi:hypothetical protein
VTIPPVVLELICVIGGIAFQTRGLPLGYQVEHRVYPGRREMRVYGHPSGHYFKSWRTWGVHLTAILKEDLQNCACVLCAGGWRDVAPANAAIIVGLAAVPGGAVPAALAATVARQEQKRREEEATQEADDLLVRASQVGNLPEWQRVMIEDAINVLRRGR